MTNKEFSLYNIPLYFIDLCRQKKEEKKKHRKNYRCNKIQINCLSNCFYLFDKHYNFMVLTVLYFYLIYLDGRCQRNYVMDLCCKTKESELCVWKFLIFSRVLWAFVQKDREFRDNNTVVRSSDLSTQKKCGFNCYFLHFCRNNKANFFRKFFNNQKLLQN